MPLRETLHAIGEDLKAATAERLKQGIDADGRSLAPKEDTSKPLGVSKGRGLFPLLESAPVTVTEGAVSIKFDDIVEDFNDGGGRKPARRIVGFAAEDLRKAADAIAASLVKDVARDR